MDYERTDLWHNDCAKCPYCGYEDIDSFELSDDITESDGITECPSCGKEYGVMRNIEITYTTWELKDDRVLGGSNE